jgi:hypothetical protein
MSLIPTSPPSLVGWLLGLLPWWAWAALVALMVTAAAGKGWQAGSGHVQARWNAEKAERVQQALEASQEARRIEQQRAAKVQEIQDGKDADLRRINARLGAALEQLRNRPNRPADLPEAGRAACAGASGAELSGPDASFLEREAARADALRRELGACQERERAALSQPAKPE